MKKLLNSRYLWVVTALLGTFVLPLLTVPCYAILVSNPQFKHLVYENDYSFAVRPGGWKSALTAAFFTLIFQFPAGLILGGCAGHALYLWRKGKQRFSRLIKQLILGGTMLSIPSFGWWTSRLWYDQKMYKLLFFAPVLIYSLFFALVLLLWGFHLPTLKAESQTEMESSP